MNSSVAVVHQLCYIPHLWIYHISATARRVIEAVDSGVFISNWKYLALVKIGIRITKWSRTSYPASKLATKVTTVLGEPRVPRPSSEMKPSLVEESSFYPRRVP